MAPECPTIALNRARVQELQKRIGVDPDGFWGPKSVAACKRHLQGMMPKPNPWPGPSDAAMRRFYGSPGAGIVSLNVDGLGVQYDGKPVSSISCHSKVADSLHRVLQALSQSPHAWILRHYAGCYNNRKMRGGSRLSKHAWGAAIDLWPEKNSLKAAWPIQASMPIEVMEAFAREGWCPAGAMWGWDAMHFQSTT